MMQFRIFIVILFVFLSLSLSAQQINTFQQQNVDATADSTFTKSIRYLHNNGYRITAVDRSSGFIQVQTYIKYNKVFSAKMGEWRTCNFLIQPGNSNQALVTLNIYQVDKIFGGDIHNKTAYDEDNGLSNDPKLYQEIWDKLLPALR
ncbi:hypothetical protein ACR79M_16890 [Sphingobacterium spiritivorum]|uniref:hypothetical protein n=1 Tax=Sphingobacterium TaxID=28453 RepID=UPI0025CC52C1|nr:MULTISPECIES: hypothetical protein [unclassified Sphingobacterium]